MTKCGLVLSNGSVSWVYQFLHSNCLVSLPYVVWLRALTSHHQTQTVRYGNSTVPYGTKILISYKPNPSYPFTLEVDMDFEIQCESLYRERFVSQGIATNKFPPLSNLYWWIGMDFNHQHTDIQSVALADWATYPFSSLSQCQPEHRPISFNRVWY